LAPDPALPVVPTLPFGVLPHHRKLYPTPADPADPPGEETLPFHVPPPDGVVLSPDVKIVDAVCPLPPA
jgi:hypothetical protein